MAKTGRTGRRLEWPAARMRVEAIEDTGQLMRLDPDARWAAIGLRSEKVELDRFYEGLSK